MAYSANANVTTDSNACIVWRRFAKYARRFLCEYFLYAIYYFFLYSFFMFFMHDVNKGLISSDLKDIFRLRYRSKRKIILYL